MPTPPHLSASQIHSSSNDGSPLGRSGSRSPTRNSLRSSPKPQIWIDSTKYDSDELLPQRLYSPVDTPNINGFLGVNSSKLPGKSPLSSAGGTPEVSDGESSGDERTRSRQSHLALLASPKSAQLLTLEDGRQSPSVRRSSSVITERGVQETQSNDGSTKSGPASPRSNPPNIWLEESMSDHMNTPPSGPQEGNGEGGDANVQSSRELFHRIRMIGDRFSDYEQSKIVVQDMLRELSSSCEGIKPALEPS